MAYLPATHNGLCLRGTDWILVDAFFSTADLSLGHLCCNVLCCRSLCLDWPAAVLLSVDTDDTAWYALNPCNVSSLLADRIVCLHLVVAALQLL